jgi:hypothetical protein
VRYIPGRQPPGPYQKKKKEKEKRRKRRRELIGKGKFHP